MSEGTLAGARALAAFITRLLGGISLAEIGVAASAALPVLLWPTRAGPEAKWVEVGGPANISYYYSPDETTLRVAYKDTTGRRRVVTGNLDQDNQFRGPDGKPMAWLVRGFGIVLRLELLKDILSRLRKPKLCPAPPVRDRYGSRPEDLDYADFVKHVFNGDQATARGMGWALPNPNPASKDGMTVFDECWLQNGTMIEAKNNYHGLILRMGDKDYFSLKDQWLKQSADQVASAPDRSIIWTFNDETGATYARKLFNDNDKGRGRIMTIWLPRKVYKR
jgi:hypothetical protein